MFKHQAVTIRCNAFTLVELLVVVAIIALLIAILLPALNKARAVAQSIGCMANLKTLGAAASMYADDYTGFPRANRDLMDPNDSTRNLDGDWIKKVGSYLRGMSQDVYIAKNLPSTDPCYTCPIVKAPRTGAAAVHFGMNNWFDPEQWQWEPAPYNTYGAADKQYSNFRPSQIFRPASIFLFGDKTLLDWSPLINTSSYQPDARHNNLVNMVFVDTHAEYVTPKDSINSRYYKFLIP